jgi:adenine deaminase
MLRLGSAWFDVAAQIKSNDRRRLDRNFIILCTDDSQFRVNDGHGEPGGAPPPPKVSNPSIAIQMATLNTA